MQSSQAVLQCIKDGSRRRHFTFQFTRSGHGFLARINLRGSCRLALGANPRRLLPAHPAIPDYPVTEVWRGLMIAMFGAASAIAGILCAIMGLRGRGSNTVLALVGLMLHVSIGIIFYILWMQ